MGPRSRVLYLRLPRGWLRCRPWEPGELPGADLPTGLPVTASRLCPPCRGSSCRAAAAGNAHAPDPLLTSRLGPPASAGEEGDRGDGCNSGPEGLALSWAGGRRRRPGLGGGEALRVLGSLGDGEGGKVTIGLPDGWQPFKPWLDVGLVSPESGGISPTGSKENYDLEDITCLKTAKPKLHPASN